MAKWAGSLSATTPSKSKMIARSIVGHKSSETHPRTFEGSTRRIVESVKRGGIIAQASTRETFRGGPAGPSWLRLQPLFLNPALSSIFSPDRIDPCVVPELTVDHGHRGARADGEAAAGSRCFFFQAEDGIRDYKVTGVQTCALPISRRHIEARKLWDAGEGDKLLHFLPWQKLPQYVFEDEAPAVQAWLQQPSHDPWKRSEERRVGEECRSRWSPYH